MLLSADLGTTAWDGIVREAASAGSGARTQLSRIGVASTLYGLCSAAVQTKIGEAALSCVQELAANTASSVDSFFGFENGVQQLSQQATQFALARGVVGVACTLKSLGDCQQMLSAWREVSAVNDSVRQLVGRFLTGPVQAVCTSLGTTIASISAANVDNCQVALNMATLDTALSVAVKSGELLLDELENKRIEVERKRNGAAKVGAWAAVRVVLQIGLSVATANPAGAVNATFSAVCATAEVAGFLANIGAALFACAQYKHCVDVMVVIAEEEVRVGLVVATLKQGHDVCTINLMGVIGQEQARLQLIADLTNVKDKLAELF